MSSTTPVPERAPRGTGAGEPARSVRGAPMRALLAACAAAEAISTPPERRDSTRDGTRESTRNGAREGAERSCTTAGPKARTDTPRADTPRAA
ncbi:hypothetical protein OH807_16985 [Kitasatospora sp. NBC_01560]|uniref:hypothetical protein n=1 Tax=Kitasatospora sp. NBC_01560 TaxID=2975965 RepID=UPI00386F7255